MRPSLAAGARHVFKCRVTITTIALTKADARTPSSPTLRKVAAAMDRDGTVAFDNLFPLSLLRRLRAEVLRRHGSGELRARGLVRDIAGRYTAVLPFEGPFLTPAFYAAPALRGMLAALLGADHCISSLEAVIALPDAYEQHQHIDGPVRFDRVVGRARRPYQGDLSGLPPYAVTLCVPLCDVDEDNGPTALWPGSHRTSLRPRPPGEAEIRRRFPEEHMVGPFGRTFYFDYRLFHCGRPNLTSEPRPVLMFVFTRSWFRDPNLADVRPRIVIAKRDLARVPARHRCLFMLAANARRELWT
jgi:ectoine hydroxylase-related dioxygenase (phytanoyl-CoA dioxygenase family)